MKDDFEIAMDINRLKDVYGEGELKIYSVSQW